MNDFHLRRKTGANLADALRQVKRSNRLGLSRPKTPGITGAQQITIRVRSIAGNGDLIFSVAGQIKINTHLGVIKEISNLARIGLDENPVLQGGPIHGRDKIDDKPAPPALGRSSPARIGAGHGRQGHSGQATQHIALQSCFPIGWSGKFGNTHLIRSS